jgi:hypothetical protein
MYTNIQYKWCKPCQMNYLKENFITWSGNKKIDNFIQETQLKINKYDDTIFEWIPYNQFIYIKEIGVHSFTTVYLAEWKDGPLKYNKNINKYEKHSMSKLVLNVFHNLQIDEFLYKV